MKKKKNDIGKKTEAISLFLEHRPACGAACVILEQTVPYWRWAILQQTPYLQQMSIVHFLTISEKLLILGTKIGRRAFHKSTEKQGYVP